MVEPFLDPSSPNGDALSLGDCDTLSVDDDVGIVVVIVVAVLSELDAEAEAVLDDELELELEVDEVGLPDIVPKPSESQYSGLRKRNELLTYPCLVEVKDRVYIL